VERVKIINSITDIIDNRCKGCKLIENSQANTDGAKRKKVFYACVYGQELKTLGDQLSENRKGKTKVNEKKKPGRPKKEVKPAVKTLSQEDEINKLSYELTSSKQRMKQLESELAEKDKLIKLKTDDQAQLMKENGDLRKDLELKINDNKVLAGRKANLVEKLEEMATKEDKLRMEIGVSSEELSAYKEKLVKAESELNHSNDNFEGLKRNYASSLERERELRKALKELKNENEIVTSELSDTLKKYEGKSQQAVDSLHNHIVNLERTLSFYIGRQL
jgi:chromosome segregation ATPase